MDGTAITVENLGKSYWVGHAADRERYTALRDVIVRGARNLARTTLDLARGRQVVPGDEIEEFWALRDVSFAVQEGEALGIIGRNGAGKSTLLKILSRITEPTTGRVVLRGRVGSLLEVGTGFHPELTGRENIFLNGAILGMKRHEVRRKFDEIVEFAGVERFLDTPVKRYSSGMYVRLAFAVAAHLEPEILIVDEVLAVGDADFQEKCLGRMKDVAAGGRTVLFVSHNMGAIRQLTRRAIVLSDGAVDFVGPSSDAVERYLSRRQQRSVVEFDVRNVKRHFRGTGEARILSLRFERALPYFKFGEAVSFVLRLRAAQPIDQLSVNMTVHKVDGSPIGTGFSPALPGMASDKEREVVITLPAIGLTAGSYFCRVAIGRGNHRTHWVAYDAVAETLDFSVGREESSTGALATWYEDGWGSMVFPDLDIRESFSIATGREDRLPILAQAPHCSE